MAAHEVVEAYKYLQCTTANHNKHIWIARVRVVDNGTIIGWRVVSAWGKIGARAAMSDRPVSTSLSNVMLEYHGLLKEKYGKGYLLPTAQLEPPWVLAAAQTAVEVNQKSSLMEVLKEERTNGKIQVDPESHQAKRKPAWTRLSE